MIFFSGKSNLNSLILLITACVISSLNPQPWHHKLFLFKGFKKDPQDRQVIPFSNFSNVYCGFRTKGVSFKPKDINFLDSLKFLSFWLVDVIFSLFMNRLS
ncbi:hypothetical protein GCM10009865_53070 [Aeromicrobium ponti]